MSRRTLHDRLIEALEKGGWRECFHNTRKYTTLAHPEADDVYYFIGKNGALRRGKNISESLSVSEVKKPILLKSAPE